MPSNEEPAPSETERDSEQSAGDNSIAPPPDDHADTNQQAQEEILYLRRTLRGLADEIIAALGADPETTSIRRFDRGLPPGGIPPGPRPRQRFPREWEYRRGPPTGRATPPPWLR